MKIKKELYDMLKYIKEQRKVEYDNNLNLGTAYPIYQVQVKRFLPAPEDSCDDACLMAIHDSDYHTEYESLKQLYDNLEEDFEWVLNEYPEIYYSLKEHIEYCIDKEMHLWQFADSVKEECSEVFDVLEDIYMYHYHETWDTIAYFFTRKEAEEYTEYQAHNLRHGYRIYADYYGYANKSTLARLLRILDDEGCLNEDCED